MPNPPDLVAEAKRRLMATPGLTPQQADTWLAYVEAHGGRIALTFDGSCFAEYPRTESDRINGLASR